MHKIPLLILFILIFAADGAAQRRYGDEFFAAQETRQAPPIANAPPTRTVRPAPAVGIPDYDAPSTVPRTITIPSTPAAGGSAPLPSRPPEALRPALAVPAQSSLPPLDTLPRITPESNTAARPVLETPPPVPERTAPPPLPPPTISPTPAAPAPTATPAAPIVGAGRWTQVGKIFGSSNDMVYLCSPAVKTAQGGGNLQHLLQAFGMAPIKLFRYIGWIISAVIAMIVAWFYIYGKIRQFVEWEKVYLFSYLLVLNLVIGQVIGIFFDDYGNNGYAQYALEGSTAVSGMTPCSKSDAGSTAVPGDDFYSRYHLVVKGMTWRGL